RSEATHRTSRPHVGSPGGDSDQRAGEDADERQQFAGGHCDPLTAAHPSRAQSAASSRQILASVGQSRRSKIQARRSQYSSFAARSETLFLSMSETPNCEVQQRNNG